MSPQHVYLENQNSWSLLGVFLQKHLNGLSARGQIAPALCVLTLSEVHLQSESLNQGTISAFLPAAATQLARTASLEGFLLPLCCRDYEVRGWGHL